MRVWRANLVFWLVWLGLAAWCLFNTYDDPSSIFYNPERAYQPRFSSVRTREVDGFLQRVNSTTAPSSRSRPPLVCIGIPSVNRTSESFVEHAVGSLVDTLTSSQRELVFLVVLLADRSPTTHSAYGKEWLARLPDEVLVYGNASVVTADNYRPVSYQVRGVPRGDGRVENMRLDHSLLVERCRAQKTPYFALVEDDVVASRDWFSKLSRGLEYVEREAIKSGRDWVYLRLFYSELLMGWNAEESLEYAQFVFGAYLVLFVVLLELRRRHRRKSVSSASVASFNCLFAIVLCLWMPAVIALFFMAGRVSLHRMNPLSHRGVREMPNYGCCAQGLVFPQRHLGGLEDLLRNPPFAFAGDQILEDYARDRALKKWALDPSVLQHAGRRQSSEGPRVADVWNFSFERQFR
ncbi:hypothetical protein HIM_03444 [Hirsutella minnesotensis 3608]|uniref:Glycosyltransferase 2-like domain-containing protein n=1 Tax=Hirsutella minnesotensis 3608 TaxID=1043627 RepID=A0A0F7ZVS5_9HYPO|nr:hypothetical protein HIM_03444 [Hirsutella minnesotensis 3608]